MSLILTYNREAFSRAWGVSLKSLCVSWAVLCAAPMLSKTSYTVSVSGFGAHLIMFRGPFPRPGLNLAVWTSDD